MPGQDFETDPFAEFGGRRVELEEDPFREFGGRRVELPQEEEDPFKEFGGRRVSLPDPRDVTSLSDEELLGDVAPGSSPEFPHPQAHPDLTFGDRFLINWRGGDPAVGERYLKAKGFEVVPEGPSQYALRKPGGEWYLFDEPGTSPEDVTDVAGDVVSLGGLFGGSALGTIAGGPSGPGAFAGGVAGAGLGTGLAQGFRSATGELMGLGATGGEIAGEVGEEALSGAGAELLGVGAAKLLGLGGKGIAKARRAARAKRLRKLRSLQKAEADAGVVRLPKTPPPDVKVDQPTWEYLVKNDPETARKLAYGTEEELEVAAKTIFKNSKAKPATHEEMLQAIEDLGPNDPAVVEFIRRTKSRRTAQEKGDLRTLFFQKHPEFEQETYVRAGFGASSRAERAAAKEIQALPRLGEDELDLIAQKYGFGDEGIQLGRALVDVAAREGWDADRLINVLVNRAHYTESAAVDIIESMGGQVPEAGLQDALAALERGLRGRWSRIDVTEAERNAFLSGFLARGLTTGRKQTPPGDHRLWTFWLAGNAEGSAARLMKIKGNYIPRRLPKLPEFIEREAAHLSDAQLAEVLYRREVHGLSDEGLKQILKQTKGLPANEVEEVIRSISPNFPFNPKQHGLFGPVVDLPARREQLRALGGVPRGTEVDFWRFIPLEGIRTLQLPDGQVLKLSMDQAKAARHIAVEVALHGAPRRVKIGRALRKLGVALQVPQQKLFRALRAVGLHWLRLFRVHGTNFRITPRVATTYATFQASKPVGTVLGAVFGAGFLGRRLERLGRMMIADRSGGILHAIAYSVGSKLARRIQRVLGFLDRPGLYRLGVYELLRDPEFQEAASAHLGQAPEANEGESRTPGATAPR